MRIVCHNTDGKHEGKQRQDIDADPGRYQANVLINETMMGREGINVLLKSCKKKYTTRITSRMAMTNVSTTLWMEAKRKSFVLIIIYEFRTGRKVFRLFVNLGSDGGVDFCGITACYLENEECCAWLSVHFAMIGV